MRLHETRLVGPDPRTGRLRLDASRSKVPRPTESLRLKTDTKIPLDKFMGEGPPGMASAMAQIDAADTLRKLAPAFKARADSGGSEGRAAVWRASLKVGRGDYVGALKVAREFMGLAKGARVSLDTPITSRASWKQSAVIKSARRIPLSTIIRK
jgi:hypothetical protein